MVSVEYVYEECAWYGMATRDSSSVAILMPGTL